MTGAPEIVANWMTAESSSTRVDFAGTAGQPSMIESVQGHLVTFGHHPPDKLGQAKCAVHQHEKCGMGLRAGEDVQYGGSPFLVRAVVEGQRHQRLICLDALDRPQPGAG